MVMLMIRTVSRPFQSPFIASSIFLMAFAAVFASPSTDGGTNSIASSQNAEDQFRLGRAYYKGEGVTQSYEQAGYWYRKAADQGNLKAMHNLGVMFLEGQGTPKDEPEGYKWIRMAAEKGDPLSVYLCGVLLCEGTGVPKNTSEGLSWLKKGADSGDAKSLARLGRDAYFGDDGVPKDPKASLPLIQAAAEKGNPWACDALGHFYFRGELVPKDLHKASFWFSKGTHAAPGIN